MGGKTCDLAGSSKQLFQIKLFVEIKMSSGFLNQSEFTVANEIRGKINEHHSEHS